MSAPRSSATAIALLVATLVAGASALTGPFVLWGTQHPVPQLGPLASVDDAALRHIYSQAETIVVFVRNASLGPMRAANYPSFGAMLAHQNWAYLPQRSLPLDPLDFNGNAEIISLVGSVGQQDVEITALFNDAVGTYGAGKVLGILGNDGAADWLAATATVSGEPAVGRRQRRAVPEAAAGASSTEEPATAAPVNPSGAAPAAEADEPMEENFVYIAPGKAMMYTTAPPQLSDASGAVELREHGVVASDERKDELVRFIVTFKVSRPGDSRKITLRFRFPIADGYWHLTMVELEEGSAVMELPVLGTPPSAPVGFSYACGSVLQFQRNSTRLTLENIQVQPVLVEPRAFSDAYDCVGFTTPGILSGLFISGLLIGVIAVGLTCIWDIKTPNKYENNRGKQLAFTIQE